MLHHSVLFEVAMIVGLGVGAQWLGWRVGLPAILLLLVFGFFAGPIAGWVQPDILLGDLLQPFVSLAVGIILFEGGLSLRISELAEVGVVRRLVSVGMLTTWAISTAAAFLILDLDFALSSLLGAIVVVSGPTVIIPMLRHLRPREPIGSILRWEGIVIDPIGATFAVLVFEAVFVADEFREATTMAILGFVETVAIGGITGVVAAAVLVIMLQRYWVPDYLENAVTFMLVVAAFEFSDEIRAESGLFAVTIMGIVIANRKRLVLRHIVEFKENLGIIIVSSLFILLAARLKLEDIEHIGWESLLFLAVLIFIARPATVMVSTIGSGLDWRERLFLGWMAPRGIVAAAVASIFALELEHIGHDDAERLVPLTFMVIVGTVMIYGLTAGPMARWLKISRPQPQGVLFAGAHPWARRIAGALRANGFDVLLVDSNQENVAAASVNDLPSMHADILSERCLQEVEFCGVGRLVAMTSNSEVNSLAALQFTELFGRSEVYRLPEDHTGSPSTHREYGRVLFGDGATFNRLSRLFQNNNASIETIAFESEADIQAFRGRQDCLPLFLIGVAGTLTIVTAENALVWRVGQKIICLRSSQIGDLLQ